MMKELSIKASCAYNDQDFAETVEAFIQGSENGLLKCRYHELTTDT